MDEGPLSSPLVLPGDGQQPVVLSVPHAGRDYSEWLLANARCGLRFLEDPRVDELVQLALGRGPAAVIARAPRAVIDCNRAEDELDPRAVEGAAGPVGPRAEAGLGLIAARSPLSGSLWRKPISAAALHRRMDAVYRPYHDAVARALNVAVRMAGAAVLLDCHSMPPRRRGMAQVVFGDRHGESAAPWVMHTAVRTAQAMGFSASCNAPFAGGEIVRRHGNPEAARHALQVEVDRSLYCRADGYTPGPGFERVALLFDRLTANLIHAAMERGWPQAAE